MLIHGNLKKIMKERREEQKWKQSSQCKKKITDLYTFKAGPCLPNVPTSTLNSAVSFPPFPPDVSEKQPERKLKCFLSFTFKILSQGRCTYLHSLIIFHRGLTSLCSAYEQPRRICLATLQQVARLGGPFVWSSVALLMFSGSNHIDITSKKNIFLCRFRDWKYGKVLCRYTCFWNKWVSLLPMDVIIGLGLRRWCCLP